MKKIVLAIAVMVGMSSALMADMTAGSWKFDMKSSLKANGKADEQVKHLLKSMSKEINAVIVNKDKSVTLSNGKNKQEKFPYTKVADNKYKISAGRGMEITLVNSKQLKLGLKMQNGTTFNVLYAPKK